MDAKLLYFLVMNSVTRITFATLILSLLFVTGCAKKTGRKIRLDPATVATRAESPVSVVNTNFNPENERYNVECRNPQDCSPSTGLLVAFTPNPQRPGNFIAFNCTANLIAPDKILTNYHCVREENLRILFQLPDGTRRMGTRVVRGQAPPMRRSTDGRITVGEGIAADFAVVQLAEPIRNVQPLRQAPAIGNPEFLRAFVVNPKTADTMRDFYVDSLKCRFKTGFWWFPFASAPLASSPESYPVLGCPIFNGNSGGALVLDDNRNSLVGIVHGFHPNMDRPAQSGAQLTPEQEFHVRLTQHLTEIDTFNRDQSGALNRGVEVADIPSPFVGWFTATGCFNVLGDESTPSRCQAVGEDDLLEIRIERFQHRMETRTQAAVNRWIGEQEPQVRDLPYRFTVETDSSGLFTPFRLGENLEGPREAMRYLVPSCIVRGTMDLNRTVRLTALHTTIRYNDFLDLDLVRQSINATMIVRRKRDMGEQGAVLEITYRVNEDSVPAELKDAFPREYTTPFCQ